MSRLSRLTSILTQLQSKRLVTASEIADKYKISVRTVYRDIRALEDAGVPIRVEEGRGYSLIDGYRLPPVMFTEQEANAMITAEKIIKQNKDSSLIEHYQNAIEKVKSVLRNTEKDKADLLSERIAYIKNVPGETTSDHLATIESAITNFQLLNVNYKTGYSNETNQRLVEAQALYHTQDNWILIAWCHLRNDYREFRLDRILGIDVLADNFEPRKFDLMKYFYKILSP